MQNTCHYVHDHHNAVKATPISSDDINVNLIKNLEITCQKKTLADKKNERRKDFSRRSSIDLKLEQTLIASLHILGAKKGVIALENQEQNLFFQQRIGGSQPQNLFHLKRNSFESLIEEGNCKFEDSSEKGCLCPSDCSVCIPLKIENKKIGMIYLEKEKSQNQVLSEDVELLNNIADYAAKKICNARFEGPEKKNIDVCFKEELSHVHNIIVESEKMTALYTDARRIAPFNVPVLILGEPGTGKELVAKTLHRFSKRKGKFVALNCSAIPESIFENELFGSIKGAFSDAAEKTGLLEMADGGTIFLDEIGEMHPNLQPKLLRFLENMEIVRLGDTKTRKVDVRVVAATNQNLDEMIEEKKFRSDLYQRLACFNLNIPPLRKRKDDILPLSDFFLEKFSREHQLKKPTLTDKASSLLLDYQWPGNVRELMNLMFRLAVHFPGRRIYKKELMTVSKKFNGKNGGGQFPPFLSIKEMEKRHIENALQAVEFNISKAAKMLDIARSTLHDKIKKYNIIQK